MFGDLFEEDEDFSILPSSPNTNGKKSHPRDSKTPEPQGDTRLSGLRNQGGTCYLNSLLRTLFFTPEFRGLVISFFFFNAKCIISITAVLIHNCFLFGLDALLGHLYMN
uniref:USP domain-containing protein n=1 Tax=Xenopus tropicalis TaxID=8364 RepID=A0A6I8S1R0_XENTR